MSKVSALKVKTIATICVIESEGVLMVKPIAENTQVLATSIIQSLDDTAAIRIDVSGSISVKKIVELLGGIQDQGNDE